jgi:hypothetical protein
MSMLRPERGTRMLERRKQRRQGTLWAGQIIVEGSRSVAECLVRNLSFGGAKLALSGTTFVPRQFELHIPEHQAEFRAKLIWRRSGEMGVALERIEAGDAASATSASQRLQGLKSPAPVCANGETLTPLALVRRLKKLRQQTASLRRRLLMQMD